MPRARRVEEPPRRRGYLLKEKKMRIKFRVCASEIEGTPINKSRLDDEVAAAQDLERLDKANGQLGRCKGRYDLVSEASRAQQGQKTAAVA
eukprot:1225755-Lingulodinium_polyedra.AAC.1